MAKKPSLGRQKIKIAKIEKHNHLQVTFSKRRVGLFKKASELVTLCGVEICVIVSSPGGKLFSFGHPNIELVVGKFLNHPSAPPSSALHHFVEARFSDNLKKLGAQLEQVLDALEAEKKRGDVLDNIVKESATSSWWRAPIDGLDLFELEKIRISMEELQKIVTNEANKHSVVEGLAAQTYFSPSFNSFDEKLLGHGFDISGNFDINYLGYGQGFC